MSIRISQLIWVAAIESARQDILLLDVLCLCERTYSYSYMAEGLTGFCSKMICQIILILILARLKETGKKPTEKQSWFNFVYVYILFFRNLKQFNNPSWLNMLHCYSLKVEASCFHMHDFLCLQIKERTEISIFSSRAATRLKSAYFCISASADKTESMAHKHAYVCHISTQTQAADYPRSIRAGYS